MGSFEVPGGSEDLRTRNGTPYQPALHCRSNVGDFWKAPGEAKPGDPNQQFLGPGRSIQPLVCSNALT